MWVHACGRVVLGWLVSGLWLASSAWGWVLAINEGVSYQHQPAEVAARYSEVAADLSGLLGQTVTVEVVSDYAALRKGLAERRFGLALVHPAHVSMDALQQHGYRLLAVVKGFENYRAHILVSRKSTVNSLQQLRGAQIGAPDEDSITSVLLRATLRDAGIKPQDVKLTYTRFQDAVPFFIDSGLTQAGATASAKVVKAWTDQGGRVLTTSRPVPIKHVIASPALSAQQQALVRGYLLKLDTSPEGRQRLASIRYSGFEPYDENALLALATWLKK